MKLIIKGTHHSVTCVCVWGIRVYVCMLVVYIYIHTHDSPKIRLDIIIRKIEVHNDNKLVIRFKMIYIF